MKKTLLFILAIIVILCLPFLFKSKSEPWLVGPDLSEFEYTEISFNNTIDDIKLTGMLMQPKMGAGSGCIPRLPAAGGVCEVWRREIGG